MTKKSNSYLIGLIIFGCPSRVYINNFIIYGIILVSKNNKILNKFKVDSNYIIIGISEDESIYYAKPSGNKEKMELRRVQSNGKITNKTVDYNFTFVCDPMSYTKVIDVTSDGEVVLLDFDETSKKIKV